MDVKDTASGLVLPHWMQLTRLLDRRHLADALVRRSQDQCCIVVCFAISETALTNYFATH